MTWLIVTWSPGKHASYYSTALLILLSSLFHPSPKLSNCWDFAGIESMKAISLSRSCTSNPQFPKLTGNMGKTPYI